ncbi:MAG: hypothetical protein ACLR10_08595 [Oscillospiraceae bacterium]
MSHTRIFNFCHDTTANGKNKVFLSVVIYVVKAAFMPLSATREKPAIARAARLCGLLSKPRMDRVYALPNHPRYQLRYTRIFSFCHYTTARGRKAKLFLAAVIYVHNTYWTSE